MSSEMPSESQAELQQLVDTMFDIGLTPEQTQRLNDILSDDRAVDFFARYVDLHGELSWRRRGATLTSKIAQPRDNTAPTKKATRRPRRTRVWQLVAGFATAACLLLIVTGERIFRSIDSPAPRDAITASSLQGATLQLVNNNQVTWDFSKSKVTIASADSSLPPGLVAELLADGSAPSTIRASWELTDSNKQLRLFDLTIDGELDSARTVTLPIRRTGVNRIDVGRKQYRVHWD